MVRFQVAGWLGVLFMFAPLLAMAGERVLNAGAWAAKMVRRATAAGQDWEEGVRNAEGTITSGMRKAKGRYKTEMTAALAEDRWAKSVDRLTDREIIDGALKAGAAGFSQGVSNREEKIRRAVEQLQPEVTALAARLDQMPVETDAQREAKMIEAKRGMQAIGRKLAGLAAK